MFLGVALSFRFSVFIALAALIVLIGVLDRADLPTSISNATRSMFRRKVGCRRSHSRCGCTSALSSFPLAAEESHDLCRDMPKGILYGLVTLIVCSFLTMILSAAIAQARPNLVRRRSLSC